MFSMLVDVNVNSKLNDDDIIVYRNGKWVAVSKGTFLADYQACVSVEIESFKTIIEELNSNIVATKKDLADYKQEINEYKAKINVKLKEHHNVLNALTGGDK